MSDALPGRSSDATRVAVALALGVAAVYARVAWFDFVEWDDPAYVTENAAVRAGLTVPGVVWAFTTLHAANWHPLTWLSHMTDCQLFGLWPGGHHLTSLLLHVLNTVLVFALWHGLTGATGRSAFVAALFGVHPLHVESVAWVAERKDVLSAAFGLASLLAYTHWATSGRRSAYALALGTFALGLLAKPMLVTLPLLLVLLDVWPLGRLRLEEITAAPAPAPRSRRDAAVRERTRRARFALFTEKLPFVGLSLAVAVVTVVAQRTGGAVAELGALPAGTRVAHALVSYVAYLWATVWPAGLAFFYPFPEQTALWEPVGAALVLVGVTVASWHFGRAHPWLLVGWLWYVVMLLPVAGFVQVGDQGMADRFTYLPLIGIFVVVAWGAPALATRWGVPHGALGVAAALVVLAQAIVTTKQLPTWRSSEALFTRALAVTSGNFVAHNLLGLTLYEERRFDEAAAHFAAAIAAKPVMHEAHSNLGLALAAQGRFGEAIPHYQQALRIRPAYPTAQFNLAIALQATGRPGDARPAAQRALVLARQAGDVALAQDIARWMAAREW